MRTTRRRLFALLAAAVPAIGALGVVKPVEAADTTPKTHAHFEGDGCPPSLAVVNEPTIPAGNLTFSANGARITGTLTVTGNTMLTDVATDTILVSERMRAGVRWVRRAEDDIPLRGVVLEA